MSFGRHLAVAIGLKYARASFVGSTSDRQFLQTRLGLG